MALAAALISTPYFADEISGPNNSNFISVKRFTTI
jgi:hypothetical protein